MTKEEYIFLYEKCASGKCTQEERHLLEYYEDEFSLDFLDSNFIENDEREITKRIYKKLQKSIREKQVRRLRWYKWSVAAAITLFALSFSFYFYRHALEKEKMEDLRQQVAGTVKVDSNEVMLTLANGSHLALDSSNNGILTNQNNTSIRKEENKLVYDASVATNEQLVGYNSIAVPRGRDYQLVLPDGTKVWLNSESSLRFPVPFDGRERKVELTGEAYFEVAKNKEKPFRVSVKGIEVDVLGTHFNIDAYDAVQTTLVEGSVRLRSGYQEVILKPGQSGVNREKGSFKVEEANVEAVTAWKNGYFVFHDRDIESIMKDVARRYNVDIVYRGDVQNKAFYGKISLSDGLLELLKNLELTDIVQFEVEFDVSGKERRVIVMP